MKFAFPKIFIFFDIKFTEDEEKENAPSLLNNNGHYKLVGNLNFSMLGLKQLTNNVHH